VPRDAPPPASVATATITGRIVAADTGAPVTDAEVTLLSPTGPSDPILAWTDSLPSTGPPVTLDRNGRFTLRDAQPGRYFIGVVPGPGAARYQRTRFPMDADEAGQPVQVAAGQVVDLVIPLQPSGVISGRVVNDRGEPMAAIGVGLLRRLPGGRVRPVLGMAGSTDRTDDTGAFRLFGLAPGEYAVTARVAPPLIVDTRDKPRPRELPQVTYYPGTAAFAEAAAVRVQAGEEQGPLVFSIVRSESYTIRGTLFDSTGAPASGVNVRLVAVDDVRDLLPMAVSVIRTSNSDGQFEITNVPYGTHAIAAQRYGSAGRGVESAWMPLTVTGNVDEIDVRLRPAVSVQGRVIFEGMGTTRPPLYVRTIGGGPVPVNAVAAQPDPDGNFLLKDLFGPTLVRVDGAGNWHVKAVLYRGQDVTDEPVEFQAGGGALEIVLTERAAALTGSVTTGAGSAADAGVIVISDDPALWHTRFSTTRSEYTDAAGRFRAAGLRAGRYLAVAVPRSEAFLGDATPAYFELLARAATSIVIAEGETKSVSLRVVRVQ
jgi:hypothetical protein